MNDHNCGEDLAMAPWSIGKYAKRSATIHIGSEDLTSVNANTGRLFPTTADPALLNVFDITLPVRKQGAGAGAYSEADVGGVVYGTGGPNTGNDQYWLGVGGTGVSHYSNYVNLTTANMAQIDAETDFLVCMRPAIRHDGAPLMAVNDVLEIVRVTQATKANNNAQKRIRLIPPGLDTVGGYAGQREHADATKSITGQGADVSYYDVTRGPGDALDSLSDAEVIPLESGTAGYANVVKWDFLHDGSLVDVEAGDIIRFTNPNGADDQGTLDYTERVVTLVDLEAVAVTLDLAILSGEVDGRPASGSGTAMDPYLGTRVSFRRNAQFRVMYKGFDTATDSHCNFKCFIPNIIGFPEHKRCLVQVMSFSVFGVNTFGEASFADADANLAVADIQELPAVVGIEIQGVGVQKAFSTSVGYRQNGANSKGTLAQSDYIAIAPLQANGTGETTKASRLSYGWTNQKHITTDGVLINSPFGQTLHIRYMNLTTHNTLDTRTDEGGLGLGIGDERTANTIANNPTHLVLKLLFLDDDEVPMR